MNVLDLFDALHPGASWRAWRAFVAAVYGEPMSADELALFRQCTGRTAPRPGGYPEAVAIVGVQAGKTRVEATLADHAALTGEPGTVSLLVAQDQRGTLRTLLRYAREPFETVPAFNGEVDRATADAIEFKRGTMLAAYPCRPGAVRGTRACFVGLDELAFYIASDGRPTDVEMLRVARGRVATTGGKLVVISSPYAQTGALHELHRRHFGRDESDTLIWQASAPTMNPTLPADYLARMERDDPEAFRSEVLGEFRAGVSTFFDLDALAAVVEVGVRERAPSQMAQRPEYHGYADAASGAGKDSFAAAVAYKDGERAVLAACRRWQPPFNPTGVIAEASEFFRHYRIDDVAGDRYAPGFVAEGFRVHRVTYRASARTTSETYLELLPLVNSGAVVLLDHPELLRELRGLERRRGGSGRDRVDHRAGAHDDLACAAAGALVAAAGRAEERLQAGVWSTSDDARTLDRILRERLAFGRMLDEQQHASRDDYNAEQPAPPWY